MKYLKEQIRNKAIICQNRETCETFLCESWDNDGVHVDFDECQQDNKKLVSIVNVDDVERVLDETANQIRRKRVAITLEDTHPSPEFWKGWNKVLDEVLALFRSCTLIEQNPKEHKLFVGRTSSRAP